MRAVPLPLSERLLRAFFPAGCLLCGRTAPWGCALCRSCAAGLSEPLLRRLVLPDGQVLPVASAFSYEGGFRESVHRLKFSGERALAGPIAAYVVQAVPSLTGAWDALCWAPMSPRRRRARGYDQSELLAKAAAKALDLPCLSLLEKRRETPNQHELLRRERLHNLEGAFRAKEETAGLRLLLVDDVVTTGATLRECAAALYNAGALQVAGLCAGDTPPERAEKKEEDIR